MLLDDKVSETIGVIDSDLIKEYENDVPTKNVDNDVNYVNTNRLFISSDENSKSCESGIYKIYFLHVVIVNKVY